MMPFQACHKYLRYSHNPIVHSMVSSIWMVALPPETIIEWPRPFVSLFFSASSPPSKLLYSSQILTAFIANHFVCTSFDICLCSKTRLPVSPSRLDSFAVLARNSYCGLQIQSGNVPRNPIVLPGVLSFAKASWPVRAACTPKPCAQSHSVCQRRTAMHKQLSSLHHCMLLLLDSLVLSGRGPATSDFHPLGETAAFFAFDVPNVGVASAAAPNTVFFRWIRCGPVVVLLLSLLVVFSCLL